MTARLLFRSLSDGSEWQAMAVSNVGVAHGYRSHRRVNVLGNRVRNGQEIHAGPDLDALPAWVSRFKIAAWFFGCAFHEERQGCVARQIRHAEQCSGTRRIASAS